MDTVKRYFKQSRSGFLGLILVAPLFVIYEISIRFANLNFRNGADALVSNLLEISPVLTPIVLKLVLIGLLAATFYFYSDEKKVDTRYVPFLLGESVIYSLLLGTVASKLIRPFFNLPFLSVGDGLIPTSFISALGAGLYEELLFRFMLFGGLFWVGKKLLESKASAAIIAALLSSLLFSGYHYIGASGNQFQLYGFAFRGATGLILALLYLFRGFAVAVYTHVFYDIWVLGFF